MVHCHFGGLPLGLFSASDLSKLFSLGAFGRIFRSGLFAFASAADVFADIASKSLVCSRIIAAAIFNVPAHLSPYKSGIDSAIIIIP